MDNLMLDREEGRESDSAVLYCVSIYRMETTAKEMYYTKYTMRKILYEIYYTKYTIRPYLTCPHSKNRIATNPAGLLPQTSS